MINIKDSEEKKMIIAYHKACSNKAIRNLLCNSNVHAEWLMRWRDDFVVNGKCLKLWNQKFVESANKHRKGIEPPAYYNEYNEFINNVTGWMNDTYDKKNSRKCNKRKFAGILIEYRKNCAHELMQLLRCNENFSDCKVVYRIPYSNGKNFTELVKYSIIHDGTPIFKGSYDETAEYIVNTNKLIEEKISGNSHL